MIRALLDTGIAKQVPGGGISIDGALMWRPESGDRSRHGRELDDRVHRIPRFRLRHARCGRRCRRAVSAATRRWAGERWDGCR
eukprot:scaffold1201_cov125-Isochrysis_galbana.AAC.3